MLYHTASNALKTRSGQVVVVLGAHFKQSKMALKELPVTILENTDWEDGIGTSIAAGVGYLRSHSKAEGILIMLADQPLIDTSYLDKLINNWLESPQGIVGTLYPSGPGVPAIFGPIYHQELAELKGAEGARKFMLKYPADIITLDAGKRVKDIDTPEDFRTLGGDPEAIGDS